MRRLLTLLALAVLAAVIWWLTRPPVDVTELGPGARLVTRDGSGFFIVGNAASQWRVIPAEADSRGDTYPLPEGLRGWPAIDSKGNVHALHEENVVCLRKGAFLRSVELPSGTRPGRGGEARPIASQRLTLVGTDAADEPVLMWASPAGPRLFVRDTVDDSWRMLVADGAEAQPLPGLDRSQLLLAPGRRALAFLGSEGWEAWLYGSGPIVRRVAEGCDGPQASFSPDGQALVVDGKVKGLWRLEMDDETLRFMAEGNLGHHERIPFAVAFREMESGDESSTVMVAPQRDAHGYLQIFQTHLSGGGRWSLGGGNVHHYAPTVSPDGRLLAYVQAEFDDHSSEAPLEDLYLMPLDQPERGAIHLDGRRGGRPGQGPVFVGDEHTLVYIADGRVKRLEFADD